MTLGTKTPKMFKDNDVLFTKACELANVPMSRRQNAKFKRGRGLAFQFKNAARIELERLNG